MIRCNAMRIVTLRSVRSYCRRALLRSGVACFSVWTQRNREALGLTEVSTSFPKISVTGPVSPSDHAVLESSRHENRPLTSMIKRAAFVRDWPAAVAAFQESTQPDAVLYSVLMHAADRCDRPEEAFKLYEGMCRDQVPVSGVHFVSLIRLAGRHGKLARARTLQEDAAARAIPMNPFLCAALVGAYKRAGDVDGAMRIWFDAKNAGVIMTEPLLSSLMSAVARTGDVAATEALLQEAVGRFSPNRIHMNCILDACKHAGDADTALRIVAEQRASGLLPDVISFTLLLSILRLSGRQAELDIVLQQMKECNVAPDRFFVEEHLGCVLRLDIRTEAESIQDLPREKLTEARGLLQRYRDDGLELSRMAVDVEQRILRRLATGTSTTEWFRVLCQNAGAPRSEYFWERTSGLTQWEFPVGQRIAGTVEASPGTATSGS